MRQPLLDRMAARQFENTTTAAVRDILAKALAKKKKRQAHRSLTVVTSPRYKWLRILDWISPHRKMKPLGIESPAKRQ